MERREKKALGVLGGMAVCMMAMAVPAYAQEQEPVSLAADENPAGTVLEDAAWENKAAANVEMVANIRAEASQEAQKVGVLPRGAAVDVLERGEDWTKVGTQELTGYIRNDLLVYGQEAKNLYSEVHGISGTVEAENLRVRKEPSLESQQIGSEPQGTRIQLLGQDGEWFQVRIDGTDAYMFADYITVNELEESAMTEAAYEEKLAQEEAKRAEEEAAKQEALAGDAESSGNDQAQQSSGGSQQVSASDSELDLLAAIIQCEAGGESHTGKVAVGAVIMNRIRDGRFPDSISGVVYQSGQFSPVSSGALDQVLSQGAREDCYAAAREALNGSNPVGDALYFNSGTGKGIQIGNQHFY